MSDFLARVRVVLSALPTWLAVAALAAPIVAQEAASFLPSPVSDRVTAVALTAVAVITALLNVIARVKPVVDKAEQGLL